MPVLNPDSHPWSLVSIRAHTPRASGVYGIFATHWIYFGHGDDIQARLLGHFRGDRPCIRQHQPLGFTFELVPYAERAQRLAQLHAELRPICNPLAAIPHEGAAEAAAAPPGPISLAPTEPLSVVAARALRRWWGEQRRRKLAPS